MKDIFLSLLFGFMLGAVVTTSVAKDDIMYYQQAEVVAYNETSVYFATQDNDIFHIEGNKEDYPDDVPYLLHMNNDNDEIIVVWKCAK